MEIPAPKFPFRHRLKVQMRWSDFDMLGHVNNNIYFQYMDLAKSDYFLSLLRDEFNPKKDALVIVNVNCNFFSITSMHETLEVLTQVLSISEHSLQLEQRVVNPETGDVKCVCRTIMAGFDVATATSIIIPDSWRSLLSSFEQRQL